MIMAIWREAEFGADGGGVLAEGRDGAHGRFAARDADRGEQGADRPARGAHLAPPVPGRQLRMRRELRWRAQLGTGDARLVQRGHQPVRRDIPQRVLDDRGQLAVMRDPAWVGGEPAVVDQVGPAQDLLAQHRPLAVVLYAY